MAIDSLRLQDAPSRLWRWWTAQLADIASLASPTSLGLKAAELTVSQDRDGSWIGASNDGRRGTDSALANVINPKRSQTVRLHLQAADCFVRRVALPNVARSEIVRLLALDLERATPFKISENYSGHVVDDVRDRPGFVNVVQVIAPRDVVDAKRAYLSSLGLRVTDINCTNADASLAPLNLLTAASEDDARSTRRPMLTWLVPAALLFAGTAAAIDVARHDAANAALVAQTTDALAIAKARRQTSQSAETALAQTAAVQKHSQTRVKRTHILNELARILPDTTWLSEIKIDGEVVEISGQSESAAALIGIFESSSQFTDAEITSAITRVETLNRERFSIRALVRPPSTSTDAATEPLEPTP